MTMHLVGPWMTTTKYNRKNKKTKNKRELAAQAEHDAWLRKQGVHPEQLKKALPHDAKGRRLGVYDMPNYKSEGPDIPTSDSVGNGLKRHENRYTGNEIAGIGLLHKSNLVPVRKDSNDAKEIARMRRG